MSDKSVIDTATIEMLRELQDENDPHVLRDLIELFINSTPERIEKIRKAIQDNDPRSVTLEAHTLKSSAANLGAFRMRDTCAQLEALGNTGRIEGAAPLLESIVAELATACAELRTIASQ